MKAKKNRKAELYAKLMYLIVLKNETTPHHFFIDFSGHCPCFYLRIYRGGWVDGGKPDIYKSYFNVKLKHIQEAINIVRNFK